MIDFSLSHEKFEEYRLLLEKQANIKLTADTGIIEYRGCKVEYTYSRPDSRFSFRVLHSPILFPKSRVEAEIQKWFGNTSIIKQD